MTHEHSCGYSYATGRVAAAYHQAAPMRLTLLMFGLELDVTLGPATTEPDPLRDLGTLATDRVPVEISNTDLAMGFTNGREGCADPEDGRQR